MVTSQCGDGTKMSGDSKTTVYLGNLKPSARIGELKKDLHNLLCKTLKVKITENDISIINGRKRYAVIEVHNQQNIDHVLENLKEEDDREKLKFDFGKIVNAGVPLHCDMVKSQDEDQAKADFENAKNKTPFGRRKSLEITRPDFGRAIALKSRSSASSGLMSSGIRPSSRQSVQTTRGDIKIPSRSTDLDTTIEADENGEDGVTENHIIGNHDGKNVETMVERVGTNLPQKEISTMVKKTGTGLPPELVGMKKEDVGETINRKIHMIPLANSSIKEDLSDEEFDSEAPTPVNHSMSEMDLEGGEEDDSPQEYEEIDLRHISRASLRGKLTPRIHRRRSDRNFGGAKSATRRDFFKFLDRQIGPETPDVGSQHHSEDEASINDEGTPYYKVGELVYNHDLSKEFKAFFDGAFTLKKMKEHAARCICGFLNSDKKGMLLFGVDSDGRVCGMECNEKQEERYREHIIEAAKEVYPPVYDEDYAINFSPLLEDNGRQHPSLKVIEVRVMPPGNLDTLYECKDGVFIRRNGILTGPIRPSHIQEWVKQKHFSELNNLKTSEEVMKDEMDKKDLMIRRQADTIMAQKSEIEQQKELLSKTKACTLL